MDYETRARETQCRMTVTPSSNVEHLSVVMTTETADDVTQTTSIVRSSSSSLGIAFYFRCAVVVIGVVGTAANALILYALVVSKQHKKHVLIFHQNVLDFASSLLLVITFSLKLCAIPSTGTGGYLFCMLFETDHFLWVVIPASKINLTFVTIERYLKVVYAVWSQNKLRNWMLYLAMTFAWISGFVHISATAFSSTKVVDGVCYAYMFWESPASLLANGVFYFFYFYAVVFIILILCYWRILVVIRRQARVMASHGSTSGQAQSQQIQTNVVKTMILVSALFAICDTPINVYYMMRAVGNFASVNYVVFYTTLFVSFLYICANPFIYASKFDPVRNILLKLIPCKKTSVHLIESVEVDTFRTSTSRSGQTRY